MITLFGWQVDFTEALALGLDATIDAGIGTGTTLPFWNKIVAGSVRESCRKTSTRRVMHDRDSFS
jgi:hypothetical protein